MFDELGWWVRRVELKDQEGECECLKGSGGEEEVGLNPLSDVMVFVMVFRLQWVFCGAIAIAVN